jgi:hypothetical protein
MILRCSTLPNLETRIIQYLRGPMDSVCAGFVRRETVRPIAAALCYCKYDVVRITVQPAALDDLRIVFRQEEYVIQP